MILLLARRGAAASILIQGFFPPLALSLALVLSAGGCSLLGFGGGQGNRTLGPEESPEEPFAQETLESQEVMYVVRDRVPVYGTPSAKRAERTGKTLGRGDKVLRFKARNGLVWVESPSSGISGWVEEAALSPRPPAAPVVSKPKAPAPPPEPPKAEDCPASARPSITDPKARISDSF